MVQTNWSRLVRFIASEDDKEYIGEPKDSELDIGAAIAAGQSVQVKIYSGSTALDLSAEATGQIATIKTLLPPIHRNELGILRCVGLNYKSHAAEMNLALPTVPALFYKPPTSLAPPNSTVVIPYQATNDQADFEGEVVIVIGKTGRNIREEDALDHVLAYTISNDVTARKHQADGAQWSFGKGFDAFAPMGPCLVAASKIPDPKTICFKTLLNGEVMQTGDGEDTIFSVPEIIAYLSQGTTLEAGNVIMTGTPPGIGAGRKPPVWVRPGDECRIVTNNGLGTLVNKFEYESAPKGAKI